VIVVSVWIDYLFLKRGCIKYFSHSGNSEILTRFEHILLHRIPNYLEYVPFEIFGTHLLPTSERIWHEKKKKYHRKINNSYLLQTNIVIAYTPDLSNEMVLGSISFLP